MAAGRREFFHAPPSLSLVALAACAAPLDTTITSGPMDPQVATSPVSFDLHSTDPAATHLCRLVTDSAGHSMPSAETCSFTIN